MKKNLRADNINDLDSESGNAVRCFCLLPYFTKKEMPEKTSFINHYASPLGNMTLKSNGTMLSGLWFDGQKHCADTHLCEKKDLPVFEMTKQWLDIYFSGHSPDFIPPLMIEMAHFKRSVLDVLRKIPFGTTMTYGEVASKIAAQSGFKRISAQAVGNAVGHNPIVLIIPCHRIIGASGGLVGYVAGIDKKIKLLELEGVLF